MSETLEEIAGEIANAHIDAHEFPSGYAALRDAVLSALRNERERAAKVAEKHEGHGDWRASAAGDCQSLTVKAIARAIREGQ